MRVLWYCEACALPVTFTITGTDCTLVIRAHMAQHQ
jgi:hypothetical protein